MWNSGGVWFLPRGLCAVTYTHLLSCAGERVGNTHYRHRLKEATGDLGKCLGAKLRRPVCQHLSCHQLAHSHCCGEKRGRGNWSRLGFLNLSITDILGQRILCWGAVADGRLSCAWWDI